ncbi:MAG TPA: methyltransferase domain-containing protein, partial [Candidatus Krumholzibacteria bacterium]|nr:methyltransferase domain-containing protein [Candidatus Krumholzibacteria bacterium]
WNGQRHSRLDPMRGHDYYVIMMKKHVDLFDTTYTNFTDSVHDAIRRETYGHDIGQTSWITAGEYDRLLPLLNLSAESHVLEIASGSGGPALYMARSTGARVTGLDVNESGVATSNELAAKAGMGDRVRFQLGDANARAPFDDNSFDALICMDSMNHFPDRLSVFREWHRLLRPDGRAMFTDPCMITGPVTNEELALRSSIGTFLFTPPGVNESFVDQAGFRLVRREDASENCALVAGRWRDARANHRDALVQVEGEERYEGLQTFFDAVHRLTRERRLSRILYVVEK